jgi:hypothetical protein
MLSLRREPAKRRYRRLTVAVAGWQLCWWDAGGDGRRAAQSVLSQSCMSTYLLAFCVGDSSVRPWWKRGDRRLKCTPPNGKSSRRQFALDTAVKSLGA